MHQRSDAGVRSLEKLSDSPSHWRVLNLYSANGGSQGPEPEEGSLEDLGFVSQPVRVQIFKNRTLNNAIFVKHNLRGNEVDLFSKPVAIATKIMVPLDPNNPAMGARSFFVGERNFHATVNACTGIPEPTRSRTHPDLKKLQLIDELPSLDAFLLQEMMKHNNFDVTIPSDWFDDTLGTEGRSFLRSQFEPLLQLALGGDISKAQRERFLREVFFSPDSEGSVLLAKSMRVPLDQWPGMLFTWKASIYYEWSTREIHSRYELFRNRFEGTKIYAGNDVLTQVEIDSTREKFLENASNLYGELKAFQRQFDRSYRENFLEKGDPTQFRHYLLTLQQGLVQFGISYARLEHLISYWEYAVTSKKLSTVPADYFFEIYRAVTTAQGSSEMPALA